MLTRQQILGLIPHQGTMCLLDRVERWSVDGIACVASSHLSPDNPLRRDGRLGAVCGIEYGLQAAALHGALAGREQPGKTPSPPLDGGGRGGGLKRDLSAALAAIPLPQGEGGVVPPSYLAALRDVVLHVDRLDDPAFGMLLVTATAELRAATGSIYRFAVASEAGAPLLAGRATIVLPAASALPAATALPVASALPVATAAPALPAPAAPTPPPAPPV